MRKEFYEKALPSQGVYCVAGIDKNGKITNRFTETLSDLYALIEKIEADQNVFVALNTFGGHSRKAEYAIYCKSFFIDLDVATDNPKKYPSKDAALADLEDFVRLKELPPPIRVDSGTGIHAYWLFDKEIPTEEWRTYAAKFKQLCLDHLKIDPAVTADAARILRCPESNNYKTDPPTRGRFIDTEFNEYSFDEFKDYLGKEEPTINSILASLPKGLDEDTKQIAKLDNYETTFQDIAEKSLEGSGCAQIKNILVNATMLEEPLWYAGLSIARHCTDWETAIHLMSEDHPEYNYEATVRKANQSSGKPFSCEKFAELNPKGCDGCPLRGKITNPLAVGRKLKEAKTEEYTPENAVWVAQNPEEVPVLPQYLYPYVRGSESGGIFYVPPPKIDKDGGKWQDDPICISQNDLAPFKRMYSGPDGESLMVRHAMKKDPTREFMLPMKHVYATDKFKEILSTEGVAFEINHTNHLANYFIKWNRYLQSMDKAEIMHMQMGWTASNDAFVIGTTEITNKGEERKAAASALVRNISKLLVRQGDYDIWKKSANALNEPGFEMHMFALLCGLGSPLMRMTSTSGAMISFTSVETGNAKTGAMYAGLSVWGNPKELSVVDGNATDNAFIGRLLNLKNIFFGIDEASNIDPEQLSRLIHRISQGKAKMRMQSSVNAERDLEMTASLIAMVTSNHPMYEKLQKIKASPDGEVARLIEFVIERPTPLINNPSLGREIFDEFRYNYGHAGPEFIKEFFKLGEERVKDKMDAWQTRLRKDFGDDTGYRFYENVVKAAFTAGEIARDAGILRVDLDRVYTKVVSKMLEIKDSTAHINQNDFKNLLGEFSNKNQSSFLFMDEGKMINTYEPRQLVGRIEVDTGMYYVSRTEFKKYLAELNISARQFEMVMRADKILIDVEKKRLGAGWKGGSTFHPIWVYAFKTDNVESLVNELNKS